MQTKKRICGRNASRELASPRISRAQKKLSENVQVAEKVSELITSSARKQKCTLPMKNQEPIAATNLNTRYNSVHHKASDASTQCDVVDPEGCNEGAAQCVVQAIFSPAFHISKIAGGEIPDGVDFTKLYRTGESRVDMLDAHLTQETFKPFFGEHNGSTLTSLNTTCHSVIEVEKNISAKNSYVDNYGDQVLSTDATTVNSCGIAVSNGVGLPSEVSSIYLAMKNSKLECVDEHGQDSMSTDVCMEEEDYEEFDDFDPYLFIKNLPELSSVVPTFRPMLLPKQTRSCPPTTLVLDLDETLVHSTLEPCDDADFTFPVNFNLQQHTVFVRCRPYLRDFMERVSSLFEIIIFTASQSIYAEQLLNVLDPKRRVFRHRVFRESCVFVEGNYLKDLSVLGRDLAHVIIIDNSPQAFGFQVDNGIPIESWFDDRADKELLSLLPFLESLVGVEDVRPVIAKKYNLRRRIASAAYPLLNSSRDPFER
uniref:FCP1 homology domain-containing protein n=1 Tax=Populus trichocarpa TaxID=3694 RepID=A0A3N7E9U5_POPTR|eukprot:XP_002299297.2 CTD small phosphatase-like protein 2 isoform X1 [Populus trichocarpa]